MSRKQTPTPESRYVGGGGLITSILGVLVVTLWLLLDIWWLLIFSIPLVLYVAYMIYGVLLLTAAWWYWRGMQIR